MRRRVGVLLILGLLFGVLSACGSKEPQRMTAKTLFPRILSAQKKAGGSHFTMTMQVPTSPAIKSRGEVKLGETPKDVAMAMKMDIPAGGQTVTTDMRVLNHTIYMSMGQATQGKFMKIDLDDTSNPFAKIYGELMDNLDPTTQMEQYQRAVTSFDASGTPVELDGVKAQPYKMTLDTSKLKQLAKLNLQNAKLPHSARLTLFVGPDDLPRRITSTMQAPGNAGRTHFQMDFSRWGDPVTIFAPKQAQIMQGDPFSQRPAA